MFVDDFRVQINFWKLICEKRWWSKAFKHAVGITNAAGELSSVSLIAILRQRALLWDQEAKLLELFVLLVHQSSEKIRFVIHFSLKIQSLVAAIMCCWKKSQMKYTVGFSWVYLCSKMPMWSYSFNVCPRNSSTLFLLRLVGFYIGTHHGI